MVKGYVKRFATIRPTRVQLNGTAGEAISQTVAIIPEKEYPFAITEKNAQKGDEIRFSLKEKPGKTGTEYELTVENSRKTAGQYHDIIVLKTDNPLKPELKIRVYGKIRVPKSKDKPAPEKKSDKPDSTKTGSSKPGAE